MTTAEQWKRLALAAAAAAVKAMAEADRLRAELAALRAAGGPSDADVMEWVTEHPYFGDWDTWAPIAYDHIPVLPRMALSHLYGRHAERESPFAHCVFCELFDLRAAGGQEKPNCPLTDSGLEHRPHHYLTPVPWDCPGLPAAPVGGQVEPSDAQRMLDAIRRVVPLNAELRHDGSEDPGMAAYVEGVNAAYDAAAAVSGEQS